MANLAYLEERPWAELLERLAQVNVSNDRTLERSVAHEIAASLKGFGPKQARNFLQWLGVSRFEIPIDSRVTKWLNKELLSFHLNASILSDHVYYDMVSDGVIQLCEMAGVFPCVFDAAVFASFDKPGASSGAHKPPPPPEGAETAADEASGDASEQFSESIADSPAARTLVDRVSELAAQLEAEVHHTEPMGAISGSGAGVQPEGRWSRMCSPCTGRGLECSSVR